MDINSRRMGKSKSGVSNAEKGSVHMKLLRFE